jgi:hypothetical protein
MRGLATWPPGYRPAPGGGLAVLVVVTVLAALAAPHATALRGRLAGGLPVITAPKPRLPAPPPATRPMGLTFTNGAGCTTPESGTGRPRPPAAPRTRRSSRGER